MNNSYPSQINPLTGLRFFAAFWLLLYFFQNRLDMPNGLEIAFVRNGYLGVDLFFILSGFVLAHVYGSQLEAENYSHSSFLWARLARVYPLHFVTLFMMLGIFAIGVFSGANFDSRAFAIEHIPYHFTLTHAWGLVDGDSWNFPSWSISSEWFAYLSFPLMFLIGSQFKKSPIYGVCFSALSFFIFFAIAAMRNTELTNMTWEGGVFRILPSFLGGISLWFLGQKYDLGKKWARIGVFGSLGALLIVTSIGYFPWAIWPVLMALVYFLAETSKTPDGEMISTETWVYLGEISFAMYMVHLPIDIIYYRVLDKFLNLDGFAVTFFAMLGAIIITIGAAAILHETIEKPMRNYLRKISNFKKPKKNEILPIEFISFGLLGNSK